MLAIRRTVDLRHIGTPNLSASLYLAGSAGVWPGQVSVALGLAPVGLTERY